MTSEIVKLLIFLWIFIYPLSDQSIIIAVLAIDIAVLWFWQYLSREILLPRKIKSVIANFIQTIIDNVSSLKINDYPLHVVFTSKESDDPVEETKPGSIVKHLIKSDKQHNLIVELQIYRKDGSGYQPLDLKILPSEILDGVDKQLKLLSDEVSKLISFGKRSLEYSERLFSWIKFVGVLVSFNILEKLITYL